MLPVEVTPFGHEIQEPFFAGLGATLDIAPDNGGGEVFVSGGQCAITIYDLRFANGIDDASQRGTCRDEIAGWDCGDGVVFGGSRVWALHSVG